MIMQSIQIVKSESTTIHTVCSPNNCVVTDKLVPNEKRCCVYIVVMYCVLLHIYTASLIVCLTCTIQMAREYCHSKRLQLVGF